MRRLVHLLLVIGFVVAAATSNGWMTMRVFAQPMGDSSVVGDNLGHCDGCGGVSAAAMACGTICVSMTAVITQAVLVFPAAQAAPWTSADQIAATANIKPDHAPPRG